MAIVGIAITLDPETRCPGVVLDLLAADSRLSLGPREGFRVAGVLDVPDAAVESAFDEIAAIEGVHQVNLVCAFSEEACETDCQPSEVSHVRS